MPVPVAATVIDAAIQFLVDELGGILSKEADEKQKLHDVEEAMGRFRARSAEHVAQMARNAAAADALVPRPPVAGEDLHAPDHTP